MPPCHKRPCARTCGRAFITCYKSLAHDVGTWELVYNIYSRRVSQINKPRYRNRRAFLPWGSRRACVHYKSQQCRSPKPGRVAAPLLFLILEKRSEPALRLATHRTASALRTRAPPPALFPFRRTPRNAPPLSPQNPPTTTTSGTAAGGVSEKARMHSRRDA